MSRGRNRRILSSPGKVDNSERRRMSSFLIRTGCKTVLAVIFGLAALRFFDGVYSEQHTTKTTSQHTTKRQIGIRRMRGPSECTNIQYKLQEEGKFNGADFLRYAAFCGDEPISIHQWAEIMASSNASVTRSLTNLLQQVPYPAFFFETKGTTAANSHEKKFEFVVMDAPSLHSFASNHPDANAFADKLECLPAVSVGCAFHNLGGDATLVAPRRRNMPEDSRIYSHLASFVRGATPQQISQYWHLVAQTYLDRLNAKSNQISVWLSTSGTGIAWLHMRLDDRPKYYQYRPFAQEK